MTHEELVELATNLANFNQTLQIIVEAVAGYKSILIGQGFSEQIAEIMCTDYHKNLFQQIGTKT